MTRLIACALLTAALQTPSFQSGTRLIVLHATVRKPHGELVTGLPRDAFSVFENSKRQPIELFRSDDVPVSVGLVIDNSGSMRLKRARVEAAALAFARASNPDDEMFVVNFADEARLDVPFTGDLARLEAGIGRVDSIGGTALFDAASMAIDYLDQHASRDRRALVVITDGNDNASERSTDDVRVRAQQRDIAIYSVGLLASEGHARRDLGRLAETTGGTAYFPEGVEGIDEVAIELARQMRSQYTIAYAPTIQALDGSFRKIKVTVNSSERLDVRTRNGYWATPGNRSSGGAQSPSYRITHTYTLGGDGGWDYIVPDPPNHRLFIARQNRVMVVDENTGALLGEVTGIQGAHGTALAPGTGRGFATSGNDRSVVMFDATTFKVLGRIPAAEDADAIIFDLPSNRVFTFNGDAHSSTVIDARAGTLITNIPLGGKPEYGASAGDGKVYANLTDTSEVVEIDARTATAIRRWPTAPCKQPVAMAIDPGHHRLFSGCRSGVMAVSDYQAGKVVATVPIGAGVDGAGYDAASGNLFFSNADGTLTVIHQDSPDQYQVVENVQTPPAARNMGLDPTNHRVFIVSAKFGPAPAGATGGRGRGPIVPGSFNLMVIERPIR
jgi:VWFA-related protein